MGGARARWVERPHREGDTGCHPRDPSPLGSVLRRKVGPLQGKRGEGGSVDRYFEGRKVRESLPWAQAQGELTLWGSPSVLKCF